jgi:hypothetical protein
MIDVHPDQTCCFDSSGAVCLCFHETHLYMDGVYLTVKHVTEPAALLTTFVAKHRLPDAKTKKGPKAT